MQFPESWLRDYCNPALTTQQLADLLTIREHRGDLAGLSVAFLGDGASNMAQSYLLAGATAGMHVRVASPAEYAPNAQVVADAAAIAARTASVRS